MARKLNYYIMARYNPQLGTYYIMKGQMTKAEVKRHEKGCIYGDVHYMGYETEKEYLEAAEKYGARA